MVLARSHHHLEVDLTVLDQQLACQSLVLLRNSIDFGMRPSIKFGFGLCYLCLS